MKKFSAILICLLMLATCCLAGCATFSINKVKYYNEVLATVDETKITRFDLLNAYNSYGASYYVQQMGQSESEALASTLNLLVDRELLYQYAVDNNDIYKPSEFQINSIIKDIFDSVDDQMDSYIETAKEILKDSLTNSSDDIPEEEKSDETPYLLENYTYSRRAVVKSKVVNESTEYSIEYVTPDEDTAYDKLIKEEYLKDFTSQDIYTEIQNKYFSHLEENLKAKYNEDAKILLPKVKTLFAKDLINYEYYLRDANGKKYSTNNNDLFNRYFKRTFDNNLKSQYLENIRIHYLEDPKNLDIELLTSEYSYLMTNNFNAYDKNLTSYKNKMKDIGTNGESVLYHPTTDTKFGYFIHTLISFDSIKDNLTLLKEQKDSDTYDEQYINLIKDVTAKARNSETGLIDEDAKDVSLDKIFEEYNSIKDYSTQKERLSAFINFMFKYTSDTATLNSGMPYVIGYDPSTYTGIITSDNKLEGTTSAMVTEFTKEAIDLMKTNQVGAMSSASTSDIDSLCITEYGIHLLYYVGDVNSFDIAYEDVSKTYIKDGEIDNGEKFNLFTKILNPLTKKTYFDLMFDLVYPAGSDEVYTSNNGYSEHEKELLIEAKKQHTFDIDSTKLAATKTSI